MSIKIDPSAAGTGKTRNRIFPSLRSLIKSNHAFIVVNSSIAIQEEYKINIPALYVINSDDGMYFNSESVFRKLLKALIAGEKFISITQNLFLKLDVPEIEAIKPEFHMILDEVFDPTKRVSINLGDLTENAETNLISKDSILTQKLSKTSKGNRLDYVIVYPKNLLLGWKSVDISAASFSSTMMGHWMRVNRLNFDYIGSFVKCERRIILHVADIPSHSLNQQTTNPEFYKVGRWLVKNGIYTIAWFNGEETIRSKMINKKKHNSAGMNNERHCTQIYIESAINPSAGIARFFKDSWGMTDEEITDACSTNLYYQLIMRSNAREPDGSEDIHVYMYSKKDAEILKEKYFNNCEIVLFDVGYEKSKKAKNKAKVQLKKNTRASLK